VAFRKNENEAGPNQQINHTCISFMFLDFIGVPLGYLGDGRARQQKAIIVHKTQAGFVAPSEILPFFHDPFDGDVGLGRPLNTADDAHWEKSIRFP